jgi:hypothetical protein
MVHDPNLSVVPNSYKIQKPAEAASLERNKVVEMKCESSLSPLTPYQRISRGIFLLSLLCHHTCTFDRDANTMQCGRMKVGAIERPARLC